MFLIDKLINISRNNRVFARSSLINLDFFHFFKLFWVADRVCKNFDVIRILTKFLPALYTHNLSHAIYNSVCHSGTIKRSIRTNVRDALSRSPYLLGCLMGWINDRRNRAHDNIHEFTDLPLTECECECERVRYQEHDWGNRSHFDEARLFHRIRAKGHSFEKWDEWIRSRVRYVYGTDVCDEQNGNGIDKAQPRIVAHWEQDLCLCVRISDAYCTAIKELSLARTRH